VSKISKGSGSQWIISTSNIGKANEYLIQLALNAANPSAFSRTFAEIITLLFASAASA
jgi:hypothetical protein